MHPFSRLTVVVLLALTIWSPVGMGVMQGRTDAVRGLLCYALALLVAKVAVAGFDGLVRRYRSSSEQMTGQPATESGTGGGDESDSGTRLRRRNDVTPSAT